MGINLRTVGKELHGGLKVRAAVEGVTIESLCVRYLWRGLEADRAEDGRPKKQLASKRSGAEGPGGGVKHAEVIPLAGEPEIDGEGEIPIRDREAIRTTHDSKTCQVYKCGMCESEKGSK